MNRTHWRFPQNIHSVPRVGRETRWSIFDTAIAMRLTPATYPRDELTSMMLIHCRVRTHPRGPTLPAVGYMHDQAEEIPPDCQAVIAAVVSDPCFHPCRIADRSARGELAAEPLRPPGTAPPARSKLGLDRRAAED